MALIFIYYALFVFFALGFGILLFKFVDMGFKFISDIIKNII